MSERDSKSIRLCVLGPMLGRNPGFVTTQGEVLADLLRGDGYSVLESSSTPGRARRLWEMMATAVRRRRDYDLILLQVFGGGSMGFAEILSRLGRRLGKPILMTVHGGSMPDFLKRHPRFARGVFRRAAVVTVPSPYLHKALAAYQIPSRIIPNVIDPNDYPFRPRRCLSPRLLWMRTFHPLYNPALAVRVLSQLRETWPDATLTMAGQEKGMGEEIRRLAHELGVEQAIRFAGFLDRDGKAREFDSADLFLNTNHVDNMPVSVLEACACGLPVVATDVGGIADLLSNAATGLLVPDDNPAAMTQAIVRLLDDPSLAERLSGGGRELALRSAPEQVLPLWRDAFEEAVVVRSANECLQSRHNRG